MADDGYSALPRTLRDAQRAGSRHYFTGKPCRDGHLAPRFTTNSTCRECARLLELKKRHGSLECASASAEQRRAKIETRKTALCAAPGCAAFVARNQYCNAHRLRLERRGTLERTRKDRSGLSLDERNSLEREWKRKEYLNHRKTYITRAEKWREDNPVAYQARKESYLARPDIQERARAKAIEWRIANPERKRRSDRHYVENNRAAVTAMKAAIRAGKRHATPAWLTREQRDATRAIYAEARLLTAQTGIRHEVDHIVPLNGKIVCGLHVPWNLRAITRDQNNRRPRIYRGDD